MRHLCLNAIKPIQELFAIARSNNLPIIYTTTETREEVNPKDVYATNRQNRGVDKRAFEIREELGLSALQRQLGIRRYETAWIMLQKLRRAMLRPQREPLRERVEVDENYIGNQEGLRGGRELGDRALVVGAVEVRGRASGRVRLQLVPDASARSLSGFVRRNVAPGTIVITDGWQGYAPLSGMGCCKIKLCKIGVTSIKKEGDTDGSLFKQ